MAIHIALFSQTCTGFLTIISSIRVAQCMSHACNVNLRQPHPKLPEHVGSNTQSLMPLKLLKAPSCQTKVGT